MDLAWIRGPRLQNLDQGAVGEFFAVSWRLWKSVKYWGHRAATTTATAPHLAQARLRRQSKSSVQSHPCATIFLSSETVLRKSAGQRACDSSARRLLTAALVTAVEPSCGRWQAVRSASHADDNRMALCAVHRTIYRLGMSLSLPLFIRYQKYDGRRATSHLFQQRTPAPLPSVELFDRLVGAGERVGHPCTALQVKRMQSW
jgi:hypothetical protein